MPEPVSKPAELTDFSDRLSPMLVKELRQGLRTNLFVTAFILLQGLMILCILMGAADPGSNSGANGFFWFFIFVAFIVVQPIRGFSALSSEYTLNTMDLIQLTRLDALRIAWGKWFALNAQTLLLLTAVIPYVVLRYFFGLVNVFAELGMLGLCALASGLLSAAAVGCSAFKNLILRIALLIIVVLGFGILFSFVRYEIMRGSMGGSDLLTLGALILASLFGCCFFLFMGASRIASASENHAIRKRLSGLGFAIGVWAFQLAGADERTCNVVAGIILALTLIDALTEPPPVFGPVLRPFHRHPLLRPLSWFLTPGWHTAVLFFVFPCLILWGFLMIHFHSQIDEEGVLQVLSGAAMITFPLLIIHLFFRQAALSHHLFAVYLFTQAGLGLITILTYAVAQSSRAEEIVYLLMPIPPVIFFGSFENDTRNPIFLVIALFWLAASLFLPLVRGIPLFREMGRASASFREPSPSVEPEPSEK